MPYAAKEQTYRHQIFRWRQIKLKAIEYKGGKCEKCNQIVHPSAFQFHHLDPLVKESTWAKSRLKSWDKILIELNKCILVCANCHFELHSTSKYDFSDLITSTYGELWRR
jgi:hypothetical protein